jgi:hypothetical protein
LLEAGGQIAAPGTFLLSIVPISAFMRVLGYRLEEQFQEKCETVLHPELLQNKESERAPFP